LGDGTQGWLEQAPFDGIIVTAAAPTLPTKLFEQIHPQGGLMVIPLGKSQEVQALTLIKRDDDNVQSYILEQVCFVPLISDHH
jgi:protein-L-isoaspartate(D-aspartate) O-methyltransferase